jgi:hypothetical protein
MVFQQWEEVWHYYKTAQPLKKIRTWNKLRPVRPFLGRFRRNGAKPCVER